MVGPIEIGTAAGTAIVAGWNVYRFLSEKSKTKRYELSDNPERCKDHEMRLRAVEKEMAQTNQGLAVLTTEVKGVVVRIDNIAEIFNRTAGDAL